MFLILLTLLACGDDDAGHSCLEDYSVDAGYDFVSDMWHISCPVSAEDTGGSGDCPPPTIDDLEAQCDEAGSPCADTIVVTRDAAECIAQADGMEEGLEGRYADLIFNHAFNLPIWAVSNVLTSEGAEASGDGLSIDAATGEILERSQWQRMP